MLLATTTYKCNNITFSSGDEVKVYDHCKNKNPYLGEVWYEGKLYDLTSENFAILTNEYCITIKVDDVELMEERYI